MAFDGSNFQSASGAAGILKLNSKSRLNILKHVLIVPHPLYIFQDPGCPIELFAPDKPRAWSALMFANRQISGEAAAVLYGMNTFNFLDTTPKQADLLEDFLSCIGTVNSGLLTRICINFPVIEDQSGTYQLREDSVKSLRLLRESCPKLEMLETHVQKENANGLTSVREERADIEEALSCFNTELKGSFPALKTTVVRIFTGHATPHALRAMQGMGWKVLRANE